MCCSAFHFILIFHLVADQDHDLDITREKEEKLRLEHATLSDESERLNSAYSVRP